MQQEKYDLVRAWLTKAFHDLAAARKLSGDSEALLAPAIYHCQQAAEKAVKGFLVFHDQSFAKTHNIRSIVEHAQSIDRQLASWLDAAEQLTPYVSAFRYPHEDDEPLEPTRAQFDEALAAAEGIFNFVLSLLPAETHPSQRSDEPNEGPPNTTA